MNIWLVRRIVRFVIFVGLMSIGFVISFFSGKHPEALLEFASLAAAAAWALLVPEHFSWLRKIIGTAPVIPGVQSITHQIRVIGFILSSHFVLAGVAIVFMAALGRLSGDPRLLAALLDGIPFGISITFFESDDEGLKRGRKEATDAIKKLVERVTAIHGPQPVPIKA